MKQFVILTFHIHFNFSALFSEIFRSNSEVLTGLNPSIIGGFSGLCAFMGIAATFISADLVRRFGILKVASSV